MKQKLRILTLLFCCILTANTLLAQNGNTDSAKDTIAEMQKHLSQLKQAYNRYSVLALNVEKNYIVNNLNFRLLYNSPIYKDYMQYWAGIYQVTTNTKEQFEAQFRDDILKTLARLVGQNEIQAAENLSKDLTDFNIQMGFDRTASEIVEYMQGIDNEFIIKNKNLSKVLTSSQLLKYRIPPKIVGLQEDTYKNCMIIFFHSECDYCQVEIEQIIQNYNRIVQRGIRVISIAADLDRAEYEKYSAQFPWKDKLCDFRGLNGENCNNYGIVGTPVIFLTDSEGKIINSFVHFSDIFNNFILK